jgi:hypothetical protein
LVCAGSENPSTTNGLSSSSRRPLGKPWGGFGKTKKDQSIQCNIKEELLAAFDVLRMMDPIQRAIAMPPRKIVMQRAARRKVFWDVPPLAAGAQDVHHAVHVDPPLTAAASRGTDQRLDICPFVISQVARISQVIAVVLRPVLVRPQWKAPADGRRGVGYNHADPLLDLVLRGGLGLSGVGCEDKADNGCWPGTCPEQNGCAEVANSWRLPWYMPFTMFYVACDLLFAGFEAKVNEESADLDQTGAEEEATQRCVSR